MDGLDDRDLSFVFGENTQVCQSCSVTWLNEDCIFGGRVEKRQISKINGSKLTRIGTLGLDYKIASCETVADDKIYLCFNDNSTDAKTCRLTSSPTGQFDEITESSFDHQWSRIAAADCKLKLCF